jgi:hypothetical protein
MGGEASSEIYLQHCCSQCQLWACGCPEHIGFSSTANLLKMVWEGNTMPAHMIPSSWFVDTGDVGLLHLAALTQPDVVEERSLGFAQPFTWNQVLDLFRKHAPDRTILKDIDEPPADQGTIKNSRAVETLFRK